jgi:hypothetical protein
VPAWKFIVADEDIEDQLNHPPSPGIGCGIANSTERREVILALHGALVTDAQTHGVHFESARTLPVSQSVGECRAQQTRAVLRQGELPARHPLRIEVSDDKQLWLLHGHG